jgi:hypothetical protein
LLELLTAIDNDVPIVGVTLMGTSAPYDFADASRLLGNLERELEVRSPGAVKLLRQHYGNNLEEASRKLRDRMPNLISKRVDYSMSQRVLNAMHLDGALCPHSRPPAQRLCGSATGCTRGHHDVAAVTSHNIT